MSPVTQDTSESEGSWEDEDYDDCDTPATTATNSVPATSPDVQQGACNGCMRLPF